ncbi:MAG: hypothetical protein WCH12_04885 [Candidatus Nitrotoga sp.]
MGDECRLIRVPAASVGLGAWPKYSVPNSVKLKSFGGLHSHRKVTSMSAATASACAMNSASPGWAKRSSTLAALILLRLPCALSACSEVTLSVSIEPTLKAPSSS